MKIILFVVILLFVSQVSAQETFKLPSNPRGIVVDYLAKMKVKDPSRRLSEAEKHEICRLFVKTYVMSIRKHRQDYSLSTGTPIYRLLVTNFPYRRTSAAELEAMQLATVCGKSLQVMKPITRRD